MYFDAAPKVSSASGQSVGEVVGYSHSGVPSGEIVEVFGYASVLIGLA
jgi:hypothetical protein